MAANVMKYWTLLESLNIPGIAQNVSLKDENERIETNTKQIRQFLKLSQEEVIKALVDDIDQCNLKEKQSEVIKHLDNASEYVLYSLMILRMICKNVNLKSNAVEDLISEHHKTLLIALTEDIVEKGLKPNLHSAFYKTKGSIFSGKAEGHENFHRVDILIETIASVVHAPCLRVSEDIILYYMAGIFSLLFASELDEPALQRLRVAELHTKLNKIWSEMPKVVYYRNLMLFYGILPIQQKPKVHKEMLVKLWSGGGFVALLFAIQKSEKNEKNMSEIVEKLVAQPTYPRRAQESLVQQILRFLTKSVDNEDCAPYMGTALVTLQKLYNNNEENKDLVKQWLRMQLQPLLEFTENRIMVMEWTSFATIISLFFHMFCTSTIECMPSELLVSYLPLLMACHQEINIHKNRPGVLITYNHISQLILRILNNRGKEELQSIIKSIALNDYPKSWMSLHPYIKIEEDPLNSEQMRIVQKDEEPETNSLFESYMNTLAVILQQSTFSTLCYQVFIVLLRLFPSLVKFDQEQVVGSTTNGLLLTEEEMENKIMIDVAKKYNGRIQIVNALQLLMEHKHFKNMIIENIQAFLMVLKDLLAMCDKEMDTNVIKLLLTLIREILANATDHHLPEVKCEISRHLTKLLANIQDKNIKYQISCLIKEVNNETDNLGDNEASKEQFEEARTLLESHEPYIQVEGIEKFIKLIKEKDPYTLNGVHIIAALTLNTLKSSESYTFLNCVRLFASLVYVEESTILEILSDVYLNDSAAIDYRLVVGEALLKVSKEIDKLCYKYKGMLLNTYMNGCRSTLDEFRYSSFSNLAQLCKILSFDVHNYFQELLHLINCELTFGKYMPAKRAAVMVLSDLLAGMENLVDYEEMLLPIYRLLKYLASDANEDEKMRLHAAIGLDNLSVKCKELLTAVSQAPLQKEIQIMGIKDRGKIKNRNHILYMN
ncbi:transport and golgi organization 6 [Haematobia irritans]|uniref:transport and golgi organization 6 n=1 Tax=Haematobia irritans TaxID=7368 RepID=UPI003F4FE825